MKRWTMSCAASALWIGLLAAPARGEIGPENMRMAVDVPGRVRGSLYSDKVGISLGRWGAGPFVASLVQVMPPRAGIDALLVDGGHIVFSPDVAFTAGGQRFEDEDLVAFDPATLTLALWFDGSTVGIPPETDLVGASWEAPGTNALLLAFDKTVVLPGAGTCRRGDVVRFAAGTLSVAWRAVTLGVPPRATISGLHHDGAALYFSLDVTAGSALAPGLAGRDEDVWRYDLAAGTVTLMTGLNVDGRLAVVALDEPLDTDRDGLTDFEEVSGLDDPATAWPDIGAPLSPGGYTSDPVVADTDRDGHTDGQEAVCGTDPRDANDQLRVLAIDSESGGSGRVELTWSSASNRVYAIDYTECLGAGFTNTINGIIGSWHDDRTSFSEYLGTHWFARLRVTAPAP